MRSSPPSADRSLLRATCIAGLIVAGVWCADAQQPAEKNSNSLADGIVQSVPLGVENKGFVLPSFDSAGRRTSLITAGVVRRVDDQRLYAEQFTWQQFAVDPSKNLRIDLPTAFYNLATSTLRGMQGGKVSRSDFQLEGQRFIFDTRTNQATVEGNIRMVIFDTSPKSGEKKPAKP